MTRTTRIGVALAAVLIAGCGGSGDGGDRGTDVATDARPLAYQWGGIIRLVRADGTGDRPLTDPWTGGEQLHPDWTPDGGRLVFAVADPDGTRDIWIAGVDGAGARRLLDCRRPCVSLDEPAVSPDGRSLAVGRIAARGADGASTLEVVALAGGRARRVVTMPPGVYAFGPRWAPDGRRLVVELTRFADARLATETVTGSSIAVVDVSAPRAEIRRITQAADHGGAPDWSPDGTRIVFERRGSRDGPADLRLVDPDGRNPVDLTHLGGTGHQAIQPSWTPDGTEVLFVDDLMGTSPSLARITAAGGTSAPVGVGGIPGTHPRPAPVTSPGDTP